LKTKDFKLINENIVILLYNKKKQKYINDTSNISNIKILLKKDSNTQYDYIHAFESSHEFPNSFIHHDGELLRKASTVKRTAIMAPEVQNKQ